MLHKFLHAIGKINGGSRYGFQTYLNNLHSSGLRNEPTVDEAKRDYRRAHVARWRGQIYVNCDDGSGG